MVVVEVCGLGEEPETKQREQSSTTAAGVDLGQCQARVIRTRQPRESCIEARSNPRPSAMGRAGVAHPASTLTGHAIDESTAEWATHIEMKRTNVCRCRATTTATTFHQAIRRRPVLYAESSAVQLNLPPMPTGPSGTKTPPRRTEHATYSDFLAARSTTVVALPRGLLDTGQVIAKVYQSASFRAGKAGRDLDLFFDDSKR